jgi:hypothetical protein
MRQHPARGSHAGARGPRFHRNLEAGLPKARPLLVTEVVVAKKRGRDQDADKLRQDANEAAFRTLQEAIGERPKTVPGHPGEKNPEAVKRGRKGGKKGGKARAKKLTAEERASLARKAVLSRWKAPPRR